MVTVRAPAVAGSFYPDNSRVLHDMVTTLLKAQVSAAPPPKAIIVPHAGYIYSGAVAARVYARVVNGRGVIRRVVLLGPSHRMPFRGLAASAADGFVTPLGVVPIDHQALRQLDNFPQIKVLEQAHAHEHSLEVQLPFLQVALGDFQLVPLVVGAADVDEVSAVLSRLWGGPETLIVVSSDLSHYHDYHTAQEQDRITSQAIVDMQSLGIDGEHACGYQPVNGLLAAARQHGLHAELVDLRNSGDTAGPRDRVVGYGAYAFQ